MGAGCRARQGKKGAGKYGEVADTERMTKNPNPGFCVCVCVCVRGCEGRSLRWFKILRGFGCSNTHHIIKTEKTNKKCYSM